RWPQTRLRRHRGCQERSRWVNLSRVCAQRILPVLEVIRAFNLRGHARHNIARGCIPASHHGLIWAGLALFYQVVVEKLHALEDESVGIVQLERLPRFSELGLVAAIPSLFPRDHACAVHHEVIWVRVTTVFIISNNHVWLKLA